MDSRVDTYQHIQNLQRALNGCIQNLMNRALVHDQSKLKSPEVEIFDKFTPKLANSVYGSLEYMTFLEEMQPALLHHYANNDHHPENKQDGIVGMNLLSLLEMLCDWKAASMRHKTGDIRRSIEVNQKRFGYNDQLKQIFLNTVDIIEQSFVE